MKKLFIGLTLLLISIALFFFLRTTNSQTRDSLLTETNGWGQDVGDVVTSASNPHPLSIEALRNGSYPGSDIHIVEKLNPGSNYDRYYVSYESEGNTIYTLLTIPKSTKPDSGWPVIIFNYGYIAPSEYRTTEKYIAYTDAFSSNGYILLRPDYRGHDKSEGTAVGGYGSNGYTIDVLNALSSIKKHPDTDAHRIGMWGHSMGGHITLRAMVTSSDIKAGVIWAGVVGSYPDLLNNWRRPSATPFPIPTGARRWRQQLLEQFGTPEENPLFWASISATSFLSDISGPLQLHHGTQDQSVPVLFSAKLESDLKILNKTVELYTYPGDDHNIANNFSTAIDRSVDFLILI